MKEVAIKLEDEIQKLEEKLMRKRLQLKLLKTKK